MRKFVWLVLVLLITASVAFAETEYVNTKISDIFLNGVVNSKPQDILSVISSKTGGVLEEGKINNDIKTIFALGYYKDVTASLESYKDGTRIIFNILENPVLKNIAINGGTAYKPTDLISTLGFKVGDLFSYKQLRDGIKAINLKFKNDGYTLARVTDVSEEAGDLTVFISEGIVEGISLEGNDSTRDYVIYREMKTTAGSVFNEEIFSKDLRKIFNLGFFSEVIPEFTPGSSSDKIKITLKIKETRSNTVNFGGGYGEREGWFLFGDASVNNFLGTAQGLMLRGQFGKEIRTYQFKYTNPWFLPEKLGPRTAYSLKLWDTVGNDIYTTQQDSKRLGWEMSFGKSLSDSLGASLFFGSEAVGPTGSASFEPYTSDTIGLSFSTDTRDIWMNPTKGMYNVLSFKQGWSYATTRTNFVKVGLDINNYQPLAASQVFAWHLGLGAGFGSVPAGEVYWAGGPNTVRGYNFDEMQRGTKKAIINLEYRYTFNETFQGVLFYDLGGAWSSGGVVDAPFIGGYGPGIRFNTPLGPIRLDYGIGTSSTSGQGVLHFSIGQAF